MSSLVANRPTEDSIRQVGHLAGYVGNLDKCINGVHAFAQMDHTR